jgi:hypothetical protein
MMSERPGRKGMRREGRKEEMRDSLRTPIAVHNVRALPGASRRPVSRLTAACTGG